VAKAWLVGRRAPHLPYPDALRPGKGLMDVDVRSASRSDTCRRTFRQQRCVPAKKLHERTRPCEHTISKTCRPICANAPRPATMPVEQMRVRTALHKIAVLETCLMHKCRCNDCGDRGHSGHHLGGEAPQKPIMFSHHLSLCFTRSRMRWVVSVLYLQGASAGSSDIPQSVF